MASIFSKTFWIVVSLLVPFLVCWLGDGGIIAAPANGAVQGYTLRDISGAGERSVNFDICIKEKSHEIITLN